MSERQVGSVHPIIRHQQPTRQPLFNFGPGIGDGRLGELDHKYLHKSQQQSMQRRTGCQGFAKRLSGNAMSLAGNLHVDRVCRKMVAEDERQPGDALAANQANLDRPLVAAVIATHC